MDTIKAKELERILFADGWVLKNSKGSHRQYVHPVKVGKVTIPFHNKEMDNKTYFTILKQAGLK